MPPPKTTGLCWQISRLCLLRGEIAVPSLVVRRVDWNRLACEIWRGLLRSIMSKGERGSPPGWGAVLLEKRLSEPVSRTFGAGRKGSDRTCRMDGELPQRVLGGELRKDGNEGKSRVLLVSAKEQTGVETVTSLSVRRDARRGDHVVDVRVAPTQQHLIPVRFRGSEPDMGVWWYQESAVGTPTMEPQWIGFAPRSERGTRGFVTTDYLLLCR